MTSRRPWRLKHQRPATHAAATRALRPVQARSPQQARSQTARGQGVLIMRKLIALVFHYSLNGLLADEGTEYYKFCFDLLDQHGGPDQDEQTLGFLQGAYAHIMGRTAYEGMAAALPAATDHPWSGILNAGRKVVFSRTLTTA